MLSAKSNNSYFTGKISRIHSIFNVQSLMLTFILMLFISSFANADTVLLRSGGNINGQVVDETHYVIEVQPGEQLTGQINIKVHNSHSSGAVVPVAATFTWGNRETQPWLITGHITPGWHDLTVNITSQNEYAPTTPGTYYIIIANSGEFTAGQIMSATNWSYGSLVWFDKNDLGWDWTNEQFQETRETGQVTCLYLVPDDGGKYYMGTRGANWVEVRVVQKTIEVAVDIKPGSCPNPLNVKSKGVLPVAVLGTKDFDVFTIDTASVRLAGVAPLRSSFEDVATPGEDGSDGYMDLTLKFDTQEIVAALGPVYDGDVIELTLTGVTIDETAIEGTDCIEIIAKGSK